MSSTEAARPARASLAIIFVIVFIDLLGFGIVLPLLPRYAQRFDASDLETGLLFSSYSAMQFLFAPLWGRLSDRIGRRPVLIAGLAGTSVFYALFGVAALTPSFELMFVSRIGAGIAAATISTAQAYIADCTGHEGRARGMALIGAAFGIGFTFGPMLGSVVMPGADAASLNPLPGFLAAGLSFMAMIAAWLKLPESLHRGIAPPRRGWLNISAIRDAVSVPTLGQLLLLFFIATFAFSQFETTISRLTLQVFGLSDASNFWLFTYIGITLCVMQGVLVRRLAIHVSEGPMIIAGAALMGVGLFGVSVATSRESLPLLIGIMPFLIAGFSLLTPSTQSLISRRTDPARQGEIMGVNQSASAMARILAPLCGHSLFGYGPKLPYWVGAALLVPALLLAISSARRSPPS
ncbi:MAG TPA: MFS transporter [Planctomycetota bacterium]|nr:MFS transporter [Planctomycetota bacterium]